ncbi:MAG: hypothetical protein IH985_02255 [Planctomycetes bacterium]|nr:hypothetical protein [Planctomycetota bacterium]
MFFLRHAVRFRRVLRRILRRLPNIRFPHRPREVVIVDLEVVVRRHRLGVSQPLADDVDRKPLHQLRLAARPQIVEQPRPGLQTGAADDPVQLDPQVRAGAPGSADHELGPLVREFKRLHQVRA